MNIGNLVYDTRCSADYTPQVGIVVAVVSDLCWVQYPGFRLWAPAEALEIISESR
jgi:hypothetical protein